MIINANANSIGEPMTWYGNGWGEIRSDTNPYCATEV